MIAVLLRTYIWRAVTASALKRRTLQKEKNKQD
jgi:hypothetical protein